VLAAHPMASKRRRREGSRLDRAKICAALERTRSSRDALSVVPRPRQSGCVAPRGSRPASRQLRVDRQPRVPAPQSEDRRFLASVLFAGQAGLVQPACTCADQRGRRTCAGAVLADLELTQVRKGRTCGPARSAQHARPRLGSGWLLSCRSSAAQRRFGLADRRSSRAGHERRRPSSTAATCERTSARA
jgi:hypothetical protein